MNNQHRSFGLALVAILSSGFLHGDPVDDAMAADETAARKIAEVFVTLGCSDGDQPGFIAAWKFKDPTLTDDVAMFIPAQISYLRKHRPAGAPAGSSPRAAASTPTAGANAAGNTPAQPATPKAGAAAQAAAPVTPVPADSSNSAGQPGAAAPADAPKGSADTSTLSSAKVQIGSTLKMLSVNLFQGRGYAWQGYFNVELTSSVPAAVPDTQSSTEYSDAEMELPDGGPLNLRIGVLTTYANNHGLFGGAPATYFLPSDKGRLIFGDRSEGYDRYYFAGGAPATGPSVTPGSLDISTGKMLVYIRDGIDAKMIYRGSNATLATGASQITPSSKIGDYGAAVGYYLGVGADGGLFSEAQTATTQSPAGTYRIEGLATYQYTDRDSLRYPTTATTFSGLYPNASDFKANSVAAGGRLVINITDNLAFDLTAMWPLGGNRHYMGKTLLGGISISSNKTTSGQTTGK